MAGTWSRYVAPLCSKITGAMLVAWNVSCLLAYFSRLPLCFPTFSWWGHITCCALACIAGVMGNRPLFVVGSIAYLITDICGAYAAFFCGGSISVPVSTALAIMMMALTPAGLFVLAIDGFRDGDKRGGAMALAAGAAFVTAYALIYIAASSFVNILEHVSLLVLVEVFVAIKDASGMLAGLFYIVRRVQTQ